MAGRRGAGPVATASAEFTRLSARLQALMPEILADWEREVRVLPSARPLARPLLLDHMPVLLEQIAQMAGALAQNRIPQPPEPTVSLHAFERLSVGYDLREVVAEYAVLRATITRHLHRTSAERELSLALCLLNQAIDAFIAASVERFSDVQERTLKALDRIATASLESKSLDELLQRLLQIFLEVAKAVDTAVILLREGDVLRVRAAAGLEAELILGFSLRIGEGFAGTIAATQRQICLRAAATDPLVRSPVIHERDVKALCGVPLIHDGRVIGVAHMGSLTAEEFSAQDQRLFAALAGRATAGIAQHLLMQSLAAERQQVKNALLSRDRILAVVTHDLRNPLGAVMMNADLMARDSPLGGELPRYVQQRAAIILRSSQRMSRMLDDLVDLSSIEAGRLSVVGQPEDPCKLVQEAVASFERMARDKGVALRQEMPASLPRVDCDRDRVQQIFTNLLTNALSVTRRGGSIVVGAEARPEEVVFSVADTGPGIAAQDIPNLFEPYWRGDANRYKGTGLGLAIVRGLLATHGGRIWVESEVSVGTTFFFTLPLERRAGSRPEAKAPGQG